MRTLTPWVRVEVTPALRQSAAGATSSQGAASAPRASPATTHTDCGRGRLRARRAEGKAPSLQPGRAQHRAVLRLVREQPPLRVEAAGVPAEPPPAATTRWQGTRIADRVPAVRRADGARRARHARGPAASSPYVRVSPNGISRSAVPDGPVERRCRGGRAAGAPAPRRGSTRRARRRRPRGARARRASRTAAAAGRGRRDAAEPLVGHLHGERCRAASGSGRLRSCADGSPPGPTPARGFRPSSWRAGRRSASSTSAISGSPAAEQVRFSRNGRNALLKPCTMTVREVARA